MEKEPYRTDYTQFKASETKNVDTLDNLIGIGLVLCIAAICIVIDIYIKSYERSNPNE